MSGHSMPPMSTASAISGWAPLSSIWSGPTTGQEARTSVTPPLAAPSSPASPAPDIHVGENGRIHGVDGMLDQIAQALTRHAGPMLVRDVLPAVKEDTAMQGRIGTAAGVAMAASLRPWIILGVGALGILAVLSLYRANLVRSKRAAVRGPKTR